MRDVLYDLLHDHARQLVVVGLLLVGASVPLVRRAGPGTLRWTARVLLAAFVAIVLAGTWSSAPSALSYAGTVNLVPGHLLPGLLDADARRDSGSVLQLVGNLLLLAPLGLLLPVATGLRVTGIAVAAFALSTSIEVGQHLWAPSRTADVDDIICNVLGAVAVGWVFLLVLRRFGAPDVFTRPIWTRSDDAA